MSDSLNWRNPSNAGTAAAAAATAPRGGRGNGGGRSRGRAASRGGRGAGGGRGRGRGYSNHSGGSGGTVTGTGIASGGRGRGNSSRDYHPYYAPPQDVYPKLRPAPFSPFVEPPKPVPAEFKPERKDLVRVLVSQPYWPKELSPLIASYCLGDITDDMLIKFFTRMTNELENGNSDEVCLLGTEMEDNRMNHILMQKLLTRGLDLNATKRTELGVILERLIDQRTLLPKHVQRGITQFVDDLAEDLLIDAPKGVEYFAEWLAPLMMSKRRKPPALASATATAAAPPGGIASLAATADQKVEALIPVDLYHDWCGVLNKPNARVPAVSQLTLFILRTIPILFVDAAESDRETRGLASALGVADEHLVDLLACMELEQHPQYN